MYSPLNSFIGRSLKPLRRSFFAIALLDILAWPLMMILWPVILKWVVDIFEQYEGNRAEVWGALKWPIIWGLILAVFVEVASRAMGFLWAKAIPTLQADLRLKLFDHVVRHTPRYFHERLTGSLSNKIADLTNQVEIILRELFWPVLPSLSGVILGTAVFWQASPIFALILLGWVFLHISVCLYFARASAPYQERHAATRSQLLGRIVDSLTNNFSVNLFYGFNREKERVKEGQREEVEKNYAAKFQVEKMRCYTSLFYLLVGVLLLNGAIIHFWVTGEITTGGAVEIFAIMWNIGGIVWVVGDSFPQLFQAYGTLRQAYSLMLDPEDLHDNPGAPDLQFSRGEIDFDRVHFQYGENKLFEDKNVLIQGGEKVGVVGYTGAGKSTFINLLLRLYIPQEGKITIDGQDITQVSLKSLRKAIAVIPQEPILFHRSIRENISYGRPEASEEELIQAAKFAHADEFIRKLPEGYETIVGERGAKLSGGERQRIAIARAFLTKAPILILDEATSSVDSVTEKLLQESFKTLSEGKTTLVIAHRLSTLALMDRILVFDRGKIVEEGTHEKLLSKEGLYAAMWKKQFLPK